MTLAALYVDALGTVRDWVNAQTADLVGVGKPLVKGAHLKRVSFPVTWAQLTLVGSGQAMSAERPAHRARVSATIHGPTQEAVDLAAVAYCNALASLRGTPVTVGSAVVVCIDQASITGPLQIPHDGVYGTLVDADWYLRPA